MTRIAMIGTGNVGGNLGARLSQAGATLHFGARGEVDPALLERCGEGARVVSPEDAAREADLVFLAVPGSVVLEAAASLGDLSGKILVDCTNPIRWDAGPVWDPPAPGSNAVALAEATGASVLKAFNTFGAELHADPMLAHGALEVQVAGDDPSAKAALEAVAAPAGFSMLDVGPLRNAAALENLAVLWIHLATVGGQGRQWGFQRVGRP